MNVLELLTAVRSWGNVPDIPTRFGDDELLLYLNSILRTKIVPLIMRTNEEHFRANVWYPANTLEIPIPPDAVASSIRDITVWGNDRTLCLYSLTIINPDDLYTYQYGFYIRDNTIVIYPRYNQNGEIQISYIKRRNILTKNKGIVSSVSNLSGNTTIEVPFDFSIATGDQIEFINPNPPFESYGVFTISSIVSGTISTPTQITFPNPTVIIIPLKCYATKAGETFVPQIPVEAHDLLAQATVVKYQEVNGDQIGLSSALGVYNDMERAMLTMITPRVKGEVLRITNADGIGEYI